VEDDFLAAVKSKGKTRPHPDFEDGFRYMRVVQAVADSRATNEWVPISTDVTVDMEKWGGVAV
nr:hypothetical protein [Chthoniobacterales bacterium]